MSTSPTTGRRFQETKQNRVLACILCQQRKVKCDRSFPCKNCLTARAECVPAKKTPRGRRRIPPEQELLKRIQQYEKIMRQNSIRFEPLVLQAAGPAESSIEALGISEDENQKRRAPEDGRPLERNPHRQLGTSAASPLDDATEEAITQAWGSMATNDSEFFFPSQGNCDRHSAWRVDPVLALRLWQVYIDRIDPLLKVTHTPTLQPRFINYVSSSDRSDKCFEALVLAIYYAAISTLDDDECVAFLGPSISKSEGVDMYQAASKQALVKCNFLWVDNRDSLTALLLYLLSYKKLTNPRSLSSMLGMAIRIAKRMAIHDEKSLMKRTPFDAEMCRRLWWALVLFDARIGEIANDNNTMMTLDWDCRVPLNINDSEMWEDMKEVPVQRSALDIPTEALFLATRTQMADITRRASFYTFFNPAADVKEPHPDRASPELAMLDKIVEGVQSHLASGNRLHFMTAWTSKVHLARCHLLEQLRVTYPAPCSATPNLDHSSDTLISHALNMLAADTELFSSPMTKSFQWFNFMHFPFFAYLHIARSLRQNPLSNVAEQAWEIMGANYRVRFRELNARFPRGTKAIGTFSKIFVGVITRTWEVCEAALARAGLEIIKPAIVNAVHGMMESESMLDGSERLGGDIATGSSASLADVAAQMPSQFGDHGSGLLYYSHLQINPWTPMPPPYDGVQGSMQLSANLNQLDWDAVGWA